LKGRNADDIVIEKGVYRDRGEYCARRRAICHSTGGLLSRLAGIAHTSCETRRGRDPGLEAERTDRCSQCVFISLPLTVLSGQVSSGIFNRGYLTDTCRYTPRRMGSPYKFHYMLFDLKKVVQHTTRPVHESRFHRQWHPEHVVQVKLVF